MIRNRRRRKKEKSDESINEYNSRLDKFLRDLVTCAAAGIPAAGSGLARRQYRRERSRELNKEKKNIIDNKESERESIDGVFSRPPMSKREIRFDIFPFFIIEIAAKRNLLLRRRPMNETSKDDGIGKEGGAGPVSFSL